MRRWTLRGAGLVLAAGLAACSGGTGTSGGGDGGDGKPAADGGVEIAPWDAQDADWKLPDGALPDAADGVLPDVVVLPDGGWDPGKETTGGKLGEPCNGNQDCLSGFCVESDIGYICTDVCVDDCPQGWDCKQVGYTDPDVIFVCLPGLEKACELAGVCGPGNEESEACGNCGTRTRTCKETCQWGEWSDCFGEGTCVPGAKETQGCGKCGNQERTCTDLCAWSEWGACGSEGPCAPGEWGTEVCGNCGSRHRTCSDLCAWGDWSLCGGEGVCAANAKETQACGKCGTQERSCTGECQWSGWGACQGEGECTPNEMKTAGCGLCGTMTAFCAANCLWGPFGGCLGQGVCSPGATESQSCNNCGTQTRKCTIACGWDPWGLCNLGAMDGYEENDSQAAAYTLPGMTDADGSAQTITANINPAYDADWFKVHISDTFGYQIDPAVTLTVPGGQTYKLCVTYKCDKASKTYSGCSSISGSGTVAVDVSGCQAWYEGDDDSGTATISIEPVTNGSCSNYTMKVGA